jgi:hypothetical protein
MKTIMASTALSKKTFSFKVVITPLQRRASTIYLNLMLIKKTRVSRRNGDADDASTQFRTIPNT